ncbi:sugar phosphate isomerase/epimerase family protein [Desulfacinum hydrothermale]|uniref:sugar phosphate isomerase/epimerase family protein n=1 Tax=Desulfacinum hydrothermale TaxID=109258 RepID=UPI001482A94A|nr:sugar phosphate isomerase/epimerase family protein [Desulfacinum hydrothermale]
MKSVWFDEKARRVLEQVHVNMPWRFLGEYRELILREGINLELGFSGEELDRLDLRDVEKTVAELGASQCGLTVHGPFWELCPGSQDPLIRQVTRLRLHQLVDVAAVVKPVQVVCHTGYDPRHHRGQMEAWLDRALKVWEPVLRRLEGLGIRLCLENVWEEDPELHRKIFERLSSPFLGFCLDVGHQHSFSGTRLSVWWETLEDKILELHLHDNGGDRDEHLPVGRGTVDFHDLFGRIQALDPRPVLTVEPHKLAHLVETVRALTVWLG